MRFAGAAVELALLPHVDRGIMARHRYGANDLDNRHGNWFLANQQMLAAFAFANAAADAEKSPGPRYEVRHVWGEGGHSDVHGGAILPDMLRWIWSH